MNKEMRTIASNGPMLNAYPDSIGGALEDIICFLQEPELTNAFSSFYILPSIFNTDLDRGFSVIDYSLNQLFAKKEDLKALEELNIDLKLDFILNHASVLSKQFQDILKNGENSKYKDFFINWNKFWEGHGEMTEEGYIQPNPELIQNMFFRKPGLPILMVRMPDGTNVPYWNTFYQEVQYPKLDAQDIMKVADVQYASAVELATIINQSLSEGKKLSEIPFDKYDTYKEAILDLLESSRKYLGQMDLNIKSPLVWEFYENTLKTLSSYGAKIVRLDAFAYAPKEPGEKNFLNDPGTWDLLEEVQKLAKQYNLTLLPEIHASYGEKIYELLASKGYMTYDFFLPGLIIDALENADGSRLKNWAEELVEKRIQVVNMLGCHDGIPLLDLKGLLSDEQIGKLIDTIVDRGGYVKNLHGQKNVYYQVNATYYSALGEDDRKMLLARALQMFMPGKPQIWYLDLFAGKNDHKAVEMAGAGGHKEINRTNLSLEEIAEKQKLPIVQKQIEMLKFRNQFLAFDFEADMTLEVNASKLIISWKKDGYTAILNADLANMEFEMKGLLASGDIEFLMKQDSFDE
jgi:sucrose phosphorylase